MKATLSVENETRIKNGPAYIPINSFDAATKNLSKQSSLAAAADIGSHGW